MMLHLFYWLTALPQRLHSRDSKSHAKVVSHSWYATIVQLSSKKSNYFYHQFPQNLRILIGMTLAIYTIRYYKYYIKWIIGLKIISHMKSCASRWQYLVPEVRNRNLDSAIRLRKYHIFPLIKEWNQRQVPVSSEGMIHCRLACFRSILWVYH